jgi:hypothetical protein
VAGLLVAGVVGLGVSLVGAATQLMPRQFTAQQRQQILDWEAGQRWRELPAGMIFPASVSYPAPSVLNGGTALSLTARRIGIARQASCPAATDAAVGAVLTRRGCQALLRATYVDATDSYVVTVGVAAFAASAQASAARQELSGATLTGAGSAGGVAAGIRTVPFAGTPAAWFTDGRRQISASTSEYNYVVFYTIGYADNRPREPVSSDRYASAEMTSLGAGVARAVINVLGKPLPTPHCPGTPGC